MATFEVSAEMDDLISRQAVLEMIKSENEWLSDMRSHNSGTEIVFSNMVSKVSDLCQILI